MMALLRRGACSIRLPAFSSPGLMRWNSRNVTVVVHQQKVSSQLRFTFSITVGLGCAKLANDGASL